MSFDVFNGLSGSFISLIELSLKNKARLDKLWKTVKTSKKKFRQKLRMDKPCTSCISLSPKTLIELFRATEYVQYICCLFDQFHLFRMVVLKKKIEIVN